MASVNSSQQKNPMAKRSRSTYVTMIIIGIILSWNRVFEGGRSIGAITLVMTRSDLGVPNRVPVGDRSISPLRGSGWRRAQKLAALASDLRPTQP